MSEKECEFYCSPTDKCQIVGVFQCENSKEECYIRKYQLVIRQNGKLLETLVKKDKRIEELEKQLTTAKEQWGMCGQEGNEIIGELKTQLEEAKEILKYYAEGWHYVWSNDLQGYIPESRHKAKDFLQTLNGGNTK